MVFIAVFLPAIPIAQNFTSSVWKSDGKTNIRNGMALHYIIVILFKLAVCWLGCAVGWEGA